MLVLSFTYPRQTFLVIIEERRDCKLFYTTLSYLSYVGSGMWFEKLGFITQKLYIITVKLQLNYLLKANVILLSISDFKIRPKLSLSPSGSSQEGVGQSMINKPPPKIISS